MATGPDIVAQTPFTDARGSNMEVLHSRVQHGVGQGSFHSASVQTIRNKSTDYELNYVYDCGAGGNGAVPKLITSSLKRLGFSRRSSSRKKGVLDLLVLSHYDMDHISGALALIKEFKVERVVLPYISPVELVIVLAELGSLLTPDVAKDLYDLAHGLGTTFGGIPVTLIERGSRPRRDRAQREVPGDPPTPDLRSEPDDRFPRGMVLTSKDAKGNQIPLPAKLPDDEDVLASLPGSTSVWRLRFWNAGSSQELIDDIREKLEACSFPLGDDASPVELDVLVNWLSEVKNREKALEAYKQAIESAVPGLKSHAGDAHVANFISLAMYSGPAFEAKMPHVSWNHPDLSLRDVLFPRFLSSSSTWSERVGWLGTGDAPLGEADIWDDFEAHFSFELPELSTIVVPHHGAGPVSGPGTTNKHGHPTYPVLTKIRAQGGLPIHVTEESGSSFHEVIQLCKAV
ncbi:MULTISPECIES: MBL fold metallo-hydrolase [Luteimonas]|uniref:MBL fold metallo-hydrolase n=1 Tax=Luteimonas TaxID=83614 RepID=UPI0011800E27|nr:MULTISPECIES: MBL fold metallo-hydrolase [Luteimonas]